MDWEAFVLSPGLGGLAAVAAATIAYAGLRRSVRQQREAVRKQQWWDRARWALDLTLLDDSTHRAVGFEMLAALARSEWSAEHEADVIDATFRLRVDRPPPRHGGRPAVPARATGPGGPVGEAPHWTEKHPEEGP